MYNNNFLFLPDLFDQNGDILSRAAMNNALKVHLCLQHIMPYSTQYLENGKRKLEILFLTTT